MSNESDRYKSSETTNYSERNRKRRYNAFNAERVKYRDCWDQAEAAGGSRRTEKVQSAKSYKQEKIDPKYNEWGKSSTSSQNKGKPVKKDKPNYEVTGKLLEDTNKFKGVIIKYSEPPEARKPKRRWRLYQFKGEKELPILYIHRQSGYLLGRDRKVADIPLDHPSCSKQHAALQYRLLPFSKEDGGTVHRIRPYLMDLESANGTFI